MSSASDMEFKYSKVLVLSGWKVKALSSDFYILRVHGIISRVVTKRLQQWCAGKKVSILKERRKDGETKGP